MGKRAMIRKLLQDVQASYWFLPSVFVFAGLMLAAVLDWLDHNPTWVPFDLPRTLIDTQADGARATLAVIAQAAIGVTGVTFSMTLVAVSFASGNFGPRLIGNFMRDRGNQCSLGILIGTFVYAVVVLRSVQDGFEGGADQFVPQYSLLMALALTILCVFTLIYFVHHVPETINVSRISAGLGHRLEAQLREIIDADTAPAFDGHWPDRAPDLTVCAPVSGYVQTCNLTHLTNLADDNELLIDMRPAVGEFVTPASQVFAVWAGNQPSDDLHADLKASFAIGSARTEHQNPSFLAEQLVEMCARELSPGVNDPYTAMDCLNRMAAALTVALAYNDGLTTKACGRVRAKTLNFERLFRVTFPLCRQYIRPDDITLAHALRLLDRLKYHANDQNAALIAEEITALSRKP